MQLTVTLVQMQTLKPMKPTTQADKAFATLSLNYNRILGALRKAVRAH